MIKPHLKVLRSSVADTLADGVSVPRRSLPFSATALRQKTRPLLALCLGLVLLTACAAPGSMDSDDSAASEPQSTNQAETRAEAPKENFAPLELQTLYSLLVADIAAQRNRYDVTLRNYLGQATQTGDAGIARHATLLAEMLRAEAIALRASEMWAKAAPGDANALQSAGVHQARARDLDRAMAHMTGALELGGATRFEQLASSASELTHARKQAVLEEMLELSARHDRKPELWLGIATLQSSLEQTEQALESSRKSLALSRDINRPVRNLLKSGQPLDRKAATAVEAAISARVFESQMLEKLDRSEAAIDSISSGLKDYPDNKRLRLQRARLLTRVDMQGAEDEFESLVEQHPDDYELQFTLALVYRENEQLDKAKAILDKLLAADSDNPSVNYYLGMVFEDQGEDQQALQHFKQVLPSRVFLPAQARVADILANSEAIEEAVQHLETLAEKHPEQAIDLRLLAANTLTRHGELERSHTMLTGLVEQHPDNEDLLYARSLLNEKRQDLTAAESDLRHILSIDPDNASALNALGYSLTVHTDRFAEALTLIQRAHELRPDDPAIIDSLGWVHFRLGDVETALVYLAQAHDMFPDPEVAAHYGEALWVSGQQTEARSVWREALDANPDHDVLKDIVERFGAP